MEDLEEISDTATENGKEQQDIILSGNDDDEPEEGEISDDDVCVEKVVKPLSSEVVIYDDLGRTAIYTSPNKSSETWNINRYTHFNKERENTLYSKEREGREYEKKERCRRRKSSVREGNKCIRDSSKRQSQRKLKPDKERRRKHRSPSSSSSESSHSYSSSCSCSCSSSSSSSDVCEVYPAKSRGKENKHSSVNDKKAAPGGGSSHFSSYLQKYHKGRNKKSSEFYNSDDIVSHSSPRKISQAQQPHSPPHRKEVRRTSPPLFRLKQSRSSRSPVKSIGPKNRNKDIPVKSFKSVSNRSKNYTGKEKLVKGNSKYESASEVSRKESRRSKVDKAELVDLTQIDAKIPALPGSLGEMLLKKSMKGELKVNQRNNSSVVKNSSNSKILNNGKDKLSNIQLASSDGDEKELANQVLDAIINLDEEDENELQLRRIALESSLKVLNDMRREAKESSSPDLPIKNNDLDVNSSPKPDELSNVKASDMLSFQEHLHSLFAKDFSGELATLNAKKDESGELFKGKVVGQGIQLSSSIVSGDGKEPSDSNQDIIDMEICDSSPEEDDFAAVDDILREVGEDISLESRTFHAGGEEGSRSQDGHHPNFQIPVEWAYMMPPPPPPDQPDNDISKIDNWCYDQNMHLQSMQQSVMSNSSEQVASYDASVRGTWGDTNSHATESSIGLYNYAENQTDDSLVNVPNVFCQDQNFESDQDITSNLLNLPKIPSTATDDIVGSSNGEYFSYHYASQESSLKDEAAHHYQAFMSAVLQNHTSQNTERNLVEIDLMKSPVSKQFKKFADLENIPQNVKITNNGRTLVKINRDPNQNASQPPVKLVKSNRAAARKRKKERKRIRKRKAKEMKLSEAKVKDAEGSQVVSEAKSVTDHEEDDEDVLRAQLLIDLSNKKSQREEKEKEKGVSGHQEETTAKLRSEHLARGLQKANSPSGSLSGKADFCENSPPCSFPSSSAESSPKTIPHSSYSVTRKKVIQHLSKGREGSPSQRLDVRRLSDIGGYGLDPKHSRYDFAAPHDLNIRKDILKFKFPPIKPVIINTGPDSSDEEEDSCATEAGSSRAIDTPGTSSSSSNGSGDMIKSDISSFSSNLDSLLKCMRAKTAVANNNPSQSQPNTAQPNSSAKSTPHAVRHLSRTKQAEYLRLKEQLRQKEKQHLARQLQLKKATVAKNIKKVEPGGSEIDQSSVSSSKPLPEKVFSEKISASVKTVESKVSDDVNKGKANSKDKGVAGITSAADGNPVAVTESASSLQEDKLKTNEEEDDVEALRLMVLQSLSRSKKPSTDKATEVAKHKDKGEENTSKETQVIHKNKKTDNLKNVVEGKIVSDSSKDGQSICPITKSPPRDRLDSSQECKDQKVTDSQKESLEGGSLNNGERLRTEIAKETNKRYKMCLPVGLGQREHQESVVKTSVHNSQISVSKPQKIPKKRLSDGGSEEGSPLAKLAKKDSGQTDCDGSLIKKKSVNSNQLRQKQKAGGLDVALASNSLPKGMVSTGKEQNPVTVKSSATSSKENDPKKADKASEKEPNTSVVVNKKKVVSGTKKTMGDKERQKKMEILEDLSNEYINKRSHTSEVMLELALLVQQATEEEKQRQSLKQSIVKLRSQLTAMETRFEEQSNLLKSKMEKIRKLQNQMTEDRQAIKELEAKGEVLGKEVLGADYTLPKVFDSPKRKQTLANNISALRQQMRDVSTKNKAKLEATAPVPIKGLAKPNSSLLKKNEQMLNKKKQWNSSAITTNPKGNVKTPVKNLLQVGSSSQPSVVNKMTSEAIPVVKRKAVMLESPVAKKLTKNDSNSPASDISSSRKEAEEAAKKPKETRDEVSTQNERKKLDEMNELCPYDLLGRCNDDSCTYQHLGHPKVKMPSTVASGSTTNASSSFNNGMKGDISLVDSSSHQPKPCNFDSQLSVSQAAEGISGEIGDAGERVVVSDKIQSTPTCSDEHIDEIQRTPTCNDEHTDEIQRTPTCSGEQIGDHEETTTSFKDFSINKNDHEVDLDTQDSIMSELDHSTVGITGDERGRLADVSSPTVKNHDEVVASSTCDVSFENVEKEDNAIDITDNNLVGSQGIKSPHPAELDDALAVDNNGNSSVNVEDKRELETFGNKDISSKIGSVRCVGGSGEMICDGNSTTDVESELVINSISENELKNSFEVEYVSLNIPISNTSDERLQDSCSSSSSNSDDKSAISVQSELLINGTSENELEDPIKVESVKSDISFLNTSDERLQDGSSNGNEERNSDEGNCANVCEEAKSENVTVPSPCSDNQRITDSATPAELNESLDDDMKGEASELSESFCDLQSEVSELNGSIGGLDRTLNDSFGSHSGDISGEDAQCQSEGSSKSRRGKGKQSKRTRRSPCTSNVAVRRGRSRSRNISNKPAVEPEPESPLGKGKTNKRGLKRQTATRVRKGRGRTPRGRRGSR